MENKFIENESYLHKYAKELLADTLRKVEKESGDYCRFNCLSWRCNYGVFTELPFHISDDPCYFEVSDGIKVDKNGAIDDSGETPLDRFDKNFDRGRILFVPDICIFHKGSPTILIEVVHKNHVSESKLERIKSFFGGYYVDVYEVSALEILSQVNDLSNVTFTKIS